MERFQDREVWEQLGEAEREILERDVAGLPSELETDDIESRLFDLIALRMQLAQVEGDAEGCLVRTIVQQWYAGKTCALCDASFDSVRSFGHSTALLSPEGTTVEWRELPSETLPNVFQTHRPVCWNCHIAARFRREHPDLVTDRPTH